MDDTIQDEAKTVSGTVRSRSFYKIKIKYIFNVIKLLLILSDHLDISSVLLYKVNIFVFVAKLEINFNCI